MRRRSVPLGLAALAYLLALVQRPGVVVADTKVDLYVAPARFLRNVLSVWSPTADLGHVFSAQYSGYAWPMAPWFVAGDALGLPTWLVHRLWLGTVLALAAWGIVRLLDALATSQRGSLHFAAGVLYVVNPYVAVYADRTSITLLSYAALPWLMLATHRALREPRGWRWPAVFALVLTSTGGGVNVAVTGWLLIGPLLLVLYELLWTGVPRTALRPFLGRMTAVNLAGQLWWVIPVYVQATAAPSFLPFTEQPGTIWSTTSLTESLRLMGFWTSYVGVGYGGVLRPFQASASALVTLLPVVLAGLLVPALALSAFPVTRRWRYAPFFLILTLTGLAIMSVGWPEGTPLRHAATGAYYHVASIQFLRTTYKAGALTALGLAVLGGAAFAAAWAQWSAVPKRAVLSAGGAGLVALAAWPLASGRAPDPQLRFTVPPALSQVATDLDHRPDDTRAMTFPGQLFGYARWGGTVDPILPALTRHPVAARWIVPYSDRRATDLQWTVDALVTQERLHPGQLAPLLDLLGVGDVVVAADQDRSRGGDAPAGDVVRTLQEAGLPRGRAYGPLVVARSGADRLDAPVRTPELRRVELPSGGLVQILPRGPLTIVDGGAGGIAALAAFGDLDPRRPLAYAPDLGAAKLRQAATSGARIVISDTNRRAAFVASRLRGVAGPTLPASESVSADGTMLDPWAGDSRAETVQQLSGVRSLTAPSSPQLTQFPERRPYAAFDGDPETAWLADRALEPSRRRLTVRFSAPRDVGAVDLLPYSDSRGTVRGVRIGGREFRVHRGWNHLVLGLRGVTGLTVRLIDVTHPHDRTGGAGGLRELRIGGVRVHERLRPPVLAADAVRGADLRRSSLTYLLARVTKDEPRRQPRYVGERGAALLRDAQDPERRLVRVLDPPAARRYRLDGWASVDPRLPDDALDALVAGRLPHRGAPATGATSSSRFDGLGRHRASGAFDHGSRAWIGQWIPGRPAWLAWRMPAPVSVRRLALQPPVSVRVRRPSRVSLTVDGRRGPALAVGRGGVVRLPSPVRGRAFRLEVLAARWPPRTLAAIRMRRAVGIGELLGTGMPRLRVPRTGAVRLPCGVTALRVGARRVPLAATVSRGALDAGQPLRVRACAAPVTLAAAPVLVTGATVPLRLDAVRLSSPAALAPAWRRGGGRVLDAGHRSADARDGVRVAVTGPAWLVHGESYDRRWRARCDGRDLGAPQPLQGYANAWPVDRGCSSVRFSYGPQRIVDLGYLISAIGLLVLLGAAGAGFGRRRRRGGDEAGPAPADLPAPPSPTPLPLRRAVLLALAPAVVLAAAFGLRAGAGGLVVLTVVLWRGLGDRWLAALAAGLLGVAVPVAYVVAAIIHRGELRGGNATTFPQDRIGAHWLALAGLVLLAIVLWRTLSTARARDAGATRSGP